MSRTGSPSAAACDERRKIAQFATHLRRRRCAQSWLTAVQYLSNILLPVSFQIRAFGAASPVKSPEVVECPRLRTGKSLCFCLSASEPLKRWCHSDENTHNLACFSGIWIYPSISIHYIRVPFNHVIPWSTPRAGPSPSYKSSLPRRKRPPARRGGSS